MLAALQHEKWSCTLRYSTLGLWVYLSCIVYHRDSLNRPLEVRPLTEKETMDREVDSEIQNAVLENLI
jgi:hypothetical protein